MKTSGIRCAAVAVCLAICIVASAHAAEYKCLVPTAEGFKYGTFEKLMNDAGALVSSKTGMKVTMTHVSYKTGESAAPKLITELKAGRADFTFIGAQDLYIRPDAWKVVDPLFTLTVNGKPYSYSCAYVRAADGLKSPAQLKGKRAATSSLTATYWFLYKNGVKDEPDKYFSSYTYIADNPPANLLDALLGDKIDVFFAPSIMIDMAISSDTKYTKKIRTLKCEEYDHNLIFVARKGLPPEDVKKFKDAFVNAHKDKHFQSFWFIFKALKGRFVEYDKANMANTEAIYKAAVKFKWYEKEKAFMKKYNK